MKRIQTTIQKACKTFQNLEHTQRCIYILAISVFLPYPITIAVSACMTLYLYYQGELRGIFSWEKKGKYLLMGAALAIAVAFYHDNIFGIMIGAFYFSQCLLALYYARHITKTTFEKILDIAVFFSLVSIIIILVQYYFIQASQNFTLSLKEIEDYPGFRVSATFLNPNYYAMMIEFFVLICIYRIMQRNTRRDTVKYLLLIFINLFALYMTGCRTAWVPFLVSVPLMFFFMKRKGLFAASLVLEGGGFSMLVSKLPRMDSILVYLQDRIGIWKQALTWFSRQPVFGYGPFAYNHLYMHEQGYRAHHAHNVLFDALLNYGIVGTGIALVYFIEKLKEHILLLKSGKDRALPALCAGFTATVLGHGVLDNTIIWPQCAWMFLFVYLAVSLYNNAQFQK